MACACSSVATGRLRSRLAGIPGAPPPPSHGTAATAPAPAALRRTSIRYSSSQFFGGFNRSTWTAANTLVPGSVHFIGLVGLGGDPNIRFVQPYVLNNLNPTRMLVYTADLYESMDQGDNLTDLTGF